MGKERLIGHCKDIGFLCERNYQPLQDFAQNSYVKRVIIFFGCNVETRFGWAWAKVDIGRIIGKGL